MKNYIGRIAFCVLLCLTFCKDPDVVHPDNPNQQEFITTVQLVLVDSSDATIVREGKFQDLDGIGGNAPVIMGITLDADRIYYVSVYLLDESKNPTDTISYEVKEEGNDHQLFYEALDGVALTLRRYSVGDYDDNGVPIGLNPVFRTGVAGTGNLRVTLKHQPDVKPTSGEGNISLGDMDVEVELPVVIQ